MPASVVQVCKAYVGHPSHLMQRGKIIFNAQEGVP